MRISNHKYDFAYLLIDFKHKCVSIARISIRFMFLSYVLSVTICQLLIVALKQEK